MYEEFNSNASRLFGIRGGQCRYHGDFVHNGGWYNKAGEKLGWGDLSPDDINRISSELADDELFVILGETDSHWNFVSFEDRDGLTWKKTTKEEFEPGRKYLAEKWRYIIAPGKVYVPQSRMADYDPSDYLRGQGIRNPVVIDRKDAKKLLR
jgi:hypothetical protein